MAKSKGRMSWRRPSYSSRAPSGTADYVDERGKKQKDHFSMMHHSLLSSSAFLDLKPRARALYLYMADRPQQRDGETGQPIFTFPESYWKIGKADYSYQLYKRNEDFYTDRDALIDHGFIKCLERNKNARTANKYTFSNDWMRWKTGVHYLAIPNTE